MYFFVTTKIDSTPSAIELAMIQRQRLFKKNGVPSLLVTRNYVRDHHANMAKVGVADAQTVNMYDFFQRATDCPNRPLNVKNFPLAADETIQKVAPNQYDVIWHEQHRKLIIVNAFDNVDFVDLHNPAGQLTRRDYYDTRGFLSCAQYFDNNQDIMLEQHYCPEQRPVLETYFRKNATGQVAATHQRLLNYHGTDRQFDNWDQLTAFFFDELNRQYEGLNTFIVDRSDAGMNPMVAMHTTAQKYEFLHSNFTLDPLDVKTSPIVPFTQIGLDHADQMNGFIMSTPEEAQDMTQRIGSAVTTIPIPVGSVGDELMAEPEVAFKDRQPGKIITIARLSVEKQLDHVIKAVAAAHTAVPTVSLDIYGYGDAWTGFKESKRLHALVNDNGWDTFITFKGFVHDLTLIYNSAQAMVLTSQYEGFNLGLLEGLSHGVPALAYDIKYGPANMIHSGENGVLITPNDYKQLGRTLTKLMQRPERLAAMSRAAYDLRAEFSEQAVWQKWKTAVVEPDQAVTRGKS